MSRPYAEVIGDPIAQSKSPAIHGFWLEKLGIAADYRACHVTAAGLGDYLAARRADPHWRGCNVTIPHKVSVLQFVDACDTSADVVGAANCIVPRAGNLVAFNTDTDGVAAAVDWHDSPTCLIGAGGAARAVIPTLALFLLNYPLNVIVRDPDKARSAFPVLDDTAFFDFAHAADAMRDAAGVINASPLGMNGQPAMPQDVLDALALTLPNATVFDMVYAPLETELLKAARKLGRKPVDGLTMLIGQAATAFTLFFGTPPPRGDNDAELRARLTA